MPLNLIVVVLDTLRYDAVFGDLARTPNLDRFAERAVVFDNAWGEGLPTVPFRRALYTGMRAYPWQHQIGERGLTPNLPGWHALSEAQTTLAEHLAARGYATQLIADVYHLFKPTMNFTRGFVSWDFIRGQESDTYELAAPSLATGDKIDPARLGPASYLYQQRHRRGHDDYFAAKVFDHASNFVRAVRGAEPYFLCVESFSPHEFWDPPLDYADAYYPAPGRANYIVPQMLNTISDGLEAETQKLRRATISGALATTSDHEPEPEDLARTRALYQGYTTFTDERFGRFLDTLDETDAWRDTIVVVLSDHGTELWDKGRFGKSPDRLHPYNLQMNLMIHHPDLAGRSRRVDAFVQNHDLVPTLLPLLDFPSPRLDGEDIWPLAVNDATPTRDHVVSGWTHYAAVRDREWNLVVDTYDPERALHLYNVQIDPAENDDVAAAHPDVVARQLRRLETAIGMPLPATYQHRHLTDARFTVGGLRRTRRQQQSVGDRWVASNQV
ncbi:MAG: sulfatase [Chloroflexia bacterium]|nr:sulfatase [Chloroflexia bacterium]